MKQSEAVRDFYERLPYPPPVSNLPERRDPETEGNHRRSEFHLIWPHQPFREDLEILVAGCGTSQAARYALRQPSARVTAIDVSETSLRHTRALQLEHGLDNLELHQLPIERARELGRSFDLVVCTGVLHHLPEPDEGLRALHDILDPGGAMRLMVYAQYGRAGIYMMQEYCRILGVGTSDEDLRALGDTLASLAPDHPIATVMRKAKDFCRPDAMADALLHPLDRAYSVPDVYDWLGRCGMSFGRWLEQAPYLACCGQVATTPQAARLAQLPARQQHAAVELLRGTMVSHSFISYRSDRMGDSRLIDFVGDRWRTYVPLVRPHTACVRERLPPGCAAVLINRTHRFTDLLCTVDPFEDRLLASIDGRRTIGQILQRVAAAEARAKAFFQRLWHYDQLVFDASGAE